MTISVPIYPHLPGRSVLQTGRPMSALSIANPCLQSSNHLGAHLLGGLRAIVCDPTQIDDYDGEGYLYTYRHPQALYANVGIELGYNTNNEGASISVTAGTGTTITKTWATGAGSPTDQWLWFRAPWASGDSGIQPIHIEFEGVLISKTILFDHPRQYLESGEERLIYQDATYPAIGLMYDHAIGVSASSGPSGITDKIKDIWTNYKRQFYGLWLDPTVDKIDITSGVFANIFSSGLEIRCQARRKKAATSKLIAVCLRSKVTSGEYEVKLTTGVETITEAFTGTSYGLNQVSILASTETLDSLKIEARISSGAGTLSIVSVSVMEE